jgi:uncharacterized protein with NRDE domain
LLLTMCLILFAHGVDSRYTMVIAANRDEFHDRPTASAGYWPERAHVLGGRDLEKGGSWLAVSRSGRWAAVTNFRDPKSGAGACSRGELVSRYLLHCDPPTDYAVQAASRLDSYAPFNLLIGDRAEVMYVSNRAEPAWSRVSPGVHALSNHLLDTQWPKTVQTTRRMSALLREDEAALVAGLFELLSVREPAPDHALPSTGISPEWERALSAPFVVAPGYGTRASTVVLFREDGSMYFEERSFAEGGAACGVRRFEIDTTTQPAVSR